MNMKTGFLKTMAVLLTLIVTATTGTTIPARADSIGTTVATGGVVNVQSDTTFDQVITLEEDSKMTIAPGKTLTLEGNGVIVVNGGTLELEEDASIVLANNNMLVFNIIV